jgi:uncharacterized protein YndB with AHSA1/START domain
VTSTPAGSALIVRRLIRAPAAQLFEAWTEPAQLLCWFGPRGVTCVGAEVDLRVGGRYRLLNRFPDGRVVAIEGAFTAVDPPRLLIYTWSIDESLTSTPPETVTVRFETQGEATEVVVVHERMANEEVRRGHAEGWRDCLESLDRFLTAGPE